MSASDNSAKRDPLLEGNEDAASENDRVLTWAVLFSLV